MGPRAWVHGRRSSAGKRGGAFDIQPRDEGLHLAACVDLTPPWASQPGADTGAGNSRPPNAGAGGSGGLSTMPSEADAGSATEPAEGGVAQGPDGAGGRSSSGEDGPTNLDEAALSSSGDLAARAPDTTSYDSPSSEVSDTPAGEDGDAGIDTLSGTGGATNSRDVSGAGGALGGAGGTSSSGTGGATGTGGALCAGAALDLDGETYASVIRPVQDDFTLEAWIKTTSSLSGTAPWDGRGLFHADVRFNKDDFAVSILNDRLVFAVGNPPDPDLEIRSTTKVTSGNWVHVAVTRTRSTGALQLLIDGVVEDSLASSSQTASLTAATNLTLGANPVDNTFFIGLLDEVRAWNLVRTPDQIASTMHSRLVGDETGLVGYWRFDDTNGTTALDSSRSQGVTTLVGTPSWSASDALCAP